MPDNIIRKGDAVLGAQPTTDVLHGSHVLKIDISELDAASIGCATRQKHKAEQRTLKLCQR